MKFIKGIFFAALLFIPVIVRADDSVTKIRKLPYTITAPGNYELTRNFTVASGKFGITVEARDANVVINLGGFSITGDSVGGTAAGINSDQGNTTVYNGTISGFGMGVVLGAQGGNAHDLRLLGNSWGIEILGNNIVVQNCSVIGTGGASFTYGILISENVNVQVTGCHISQYVMGIDSVDPSDSGNTFIGNYVASCTWGLRMSPWDYYQGNVTSNCGTPFSGGNAIGTENGGN
jgi:hypothetical protein